MRVGPHIAHDQRPTELPRAEPGFTQVFDDATATAATAASANSAPSATPTNMVTAGASSNLEAAGILPASPWVEPLATFPRIEPCPSSTFMAALTLAVDDATTNVAEALANGNETVEAALTVGTEPVGDAAAPLLDITPDVSGHTVGAMASRERTIVPVDALTPLDLADPIEAPAPIAHARLVVGQDDERVVVSVALRHETVDVSIRTANVDLASAVSRSLDQLDAALRNHGLTLGELVAGEERGRQRPYRPSPARDGANANGTDAPADSYDSPVLSDPRLRALA
jgi:hypothetical protein